MNRFSALAVALCAACSSSSPPAQVESQLHFAVSTSSEGNQTYACDSASSVITAAGGQLRVFCNLVTGPNASTTVAGVFLASFQGPDSYSFTGSTDPNASLVEFDLGNYSYGSVAASGGSPATTCTVVVTSPASPQRGDAVSGTFHCEQIVGVAITGDGGYQPPRTTSVDGTFDGIDSL